MDNGEGGGEQPFSLFRFAYSEQHEVSVYIGAAGPPTIWLKNNKRNSKREVIL